MPSAIIFVEGPSEETFLSRALELRFPHLSISIVNATNDGEMKRYGYMMKQLFPEFQHSPYKDRIITVLDSVHGKGITDSLKRIGFPDNQIVVWSRNGIEHLYPDSVMQQIFGGSGALSIIGDDVTMNGTTEKKSELARKVANKLSHDTIYPDELEKKLFALIDRVAD